MYLVFRNSIPLWPSLELLVMVEMVTPTLFCESFLIVDQRTGQICVLSADPPEVVGSSIVTAQ